MGKVIIQNYTCKNPITMIGFEAGICWGAELSQRTGLPGERARKNV